MTAVVMRTWVGHHHGTLLHSGSVHWLLLLLVHVQVLLLVLCVLQRRRLRSMLLLPHRLHLHVVQAVLVVGLLPVARRRRPGRLMEHLLAAASKADLARGRLGRTPYGMAWRGMRRKRVMKGACMCVHAAPVKPATCALHGHACTCSLPSPTKEKTRHGFPAKRHPHAPRAAGPGPATPGCGRWRAWRRQRPPCRQTPQRLRCGAGAANAVLDSEAHTC